MNMWQCAVCDHVSVTDEPPDTCPVCNSPKDKLHPYQPPSGGPKTWENLKSAFAGESQATLRNRAFARKSEEEGLPQISHLFRAVAAAEEVHAYNHLNHLGLIKDTQANLNAAFERENLAQLGAYPEFIRNAEEEGSEELALSFSRNRDVEKEHGKLYEKALSHMLAGSNTTYYVCQVCGYVADNLLPEECPICGAPQTSFKLVD